MLPSQFQRYTDESQPLVVDPTVAEKIGLNESIVIRQLHFWLKINERNEKSVYNDKVWCYNTVQEWKENNFNFWSESTIKRIFSNLEKLGLIETTKNPKNKWDKTKWYSINYLVYAGLFDKVNLTQSKESKWSNGEGQNDPFNNKTENTKENTKESGTHKNFEEKLETDILDIISNPLYPILEGKYKDKNRQTDIQDEMKLALNSYYEKGKNGSKFSFFQTWVEFLKTDFKQKNKTSVYDGKIEKRDEEQKKQGFELNKTIKEIKDNNYYTIRIYKKEFDSEKALLDYIQEVLFIVDRHRILAVDFDINEYLQHK